MEKRQFKGIRMTESLIKRIEDYANKRSLTFTAAVIQLVVMSLEKEENKYK